MIQSSSVLGASAAPDTDGSPTRSEPVRHDIQALRAIAVSIVVLFHLWPNRVSGGYVGVDVFFVISGYLITAHLLREVARTGRIGLATFWAKRAKRLLPASMTVLLAIVVTTLTVVPVTLWRQYLGEAITSTWYVENWALASKAVDYLTADAAPSPEQHFWSLSVEEQFYIATPILLAVIVFLAARSGLRWRTPVTVGLASVVGASFVYGVWLTATSAPTAYFSTMTRAWEFGVGGLIALIPSMRGGYRSRVLAWVGIALIVASCTLYTTRTSFPGVAALLPVLATALVILACDVEGRGSVSWVGAMTVPAFLGRTSYSLYLVHWPLIVLVPFVTGAALDGKTKFAILGASLALAYALMRLVEDPVRFSPRLLGGKRRPRTVALVSVTAMVLVTASAWGGLRWSDNQAVQAQKASDAVLAAKPSCLGAAAMVPHSTGCPDPALDGVLVPDPVNAPQDSGNRPDCWAGAADPTLKVCTIGPRTGYTKWFIAIGDSHNNAYIPAYEAMAKANHWRIDVAGHNGCAWMGAHQAKSTDAYTAACAQWNQAVTSYLATHTKYDAVLTTYGYARNDAVAAAGQSLRATLVTGLRDAWTPVIASGVPVIALNDIPIMADDVVTCVQKFRLAADTHCAVPRAQALGSLNGLAPAVAATPGAHYVDLTNFFCDPTNCLPVIGHVVVHVDFDHMTATFARTLSPFLADALRHELGA